jgi:hypothetical protein
MADGTATGPTGSVSIRGIDGLDLATGAYTVVPSEWRKDAGEQLGNLTSGSGDDGATWHLQDVEDETGTTVLEVVDDRREMEGLSPSGRQFLFRTPDGTEQMVWERDGYTGWAPGTLLSVDTGDELARWTQSIPMFGSWTLSTPDGETVATANRSWSLSSLMYPAHALEAPDGTEFGRFEINQSGLFYEVDVEVTEARIPVEVALAMAYGVSWALGDF